MFKDPSLELSDADVALLHEIDNALSTGHAAGGRSDLWVAMARSTPRADNEFRSRLRERLINSRRPRPERQAAPGLAALLALVRAFARSPRLLVATAVFVALVLPLGVAVAQGRLPDVIPITIRQPIEDLITLRSSLVRATSDAELQELISFPLWVATDVPCPGPSDRTYHPSLRTARILYQCVAVGQWSAGQAYRPAIDAGTREDVLINGLPGYYYEQTVRSPGFGGTQTTPSFVFQSDGTIITLSALPWHSPDRDGTLLTKSDLIRIAESMRPLRTP